MEGGHPERCPGLVQLGRILGLGLSPGTAELLVETEESVDDVLTWVEGCSTCTDRLETLERWQEEVCYPDLAVVASERCHAQGLWQGFADLPTEALAGHLGEEHCSWAMASLLFRESLAVAGRSVARALEVARIALAITNLLESTYYTPRLLQDLKSKAWAYLGNARRISNQLPLAEGAFGHSLSCLENGTGALMPQATVLDLLGMLRKDQGRFGEAVDALSRSAELYDMAGHPGLVGKVYLSLGIIEDLRGNLEAAVVHLTNAQHWISHRTHPNLYSLGQHHLLVCLTKAGYFEEAELRLPVVRALWRQQGDEGKLVLLQWIEGTILRGLGALEAHQSFVDGGAPMSSLSVLPGLEGCRECGQGDQEFSGEAVGAEEAPWKRSRVRCRALSEVFEGSP